MIAVECVYLRKGTPGRWDSRCKGPEVKEDPGSDQREWMRWSGERTDGEESEL